MGKYGHYEFYNKFIGLNSNWRMDNMAQIVGILYSSIISKSTLLKKNYRVFCQFSTYIDLDVKMIRCAPKTTFSVGIRVISIN